MLTACHEFRVTGKGSNAWVLKWIYVWAGLKDNQKEGTQSHWSAQLKDICSLLKTDPPPPLIRPLHLQAHLHVQEEKYSGYKANAQTVFKLGQKSDIFGFSLSYIINRRRFLIRCMIVLAYFLSLYLKTFLRYHLLDPSRKYGNQKVRRRRHICLSLQFRFSLHLLIRVITFYLLVLIFYLCKVERKTF